MRAAVLLAAGASRRFGAADKLMAPLDGAPLVTHAARTLRALPVERRFAVVSSPVVGGVLGQMGLEVVAIAPGQGQAASLVAATAALGDETHLLVMLGDMPFLRPPHIQPLLDADPDTPHGTAGETVLPPAIFPRAWFPRLSALSGDQGAGRLLRDLPPAAHLPLPPGVLRDIDTPADLRPAGGPAEPDAPSGA